ncbi:MAG: hypothetical protein KDI30_05050 [Pseudomonadales bacterium]|nr:hypothetical protein [Pseudomonadales bacterium]
MTGWIGVDLDGTLAHYDGWLSPEHIGDPIEPMVRRIHQWQHEGIEVRVMTARASRSEMIAPVEKWLSHHDMPNIKVTNRKDFNLLQLWDDRAIQIETNTGKVLTPREHISLEAKGWIGVELDGTLAHFEKGQDPKTIGTPVGPMYQRVREWLMAGIDVRLFTARASLPAMHPVIQQWLQTHKLDSMKVCFEKDFEMTTFWDDRGIHVVGNTGNIVVPINDFIPDHKYR